MHLGIQHTALLNDAFFCVNDNNAKICRYIESCVHRIHVVDFLIDVPLCVLYSGNIHHIAVGVEQLYVGVVVANGQTT